MKQILADASGGRIHLEEVPEPLVQPGTIRVSTRVSVISSGTERSVLDLAQRSMLGKAIARPDLVKKTVEKVRTAGWRQALEAVQSRLGQPLPLGYAASGIVEEVGSGVSEFSVGDRVAVAGAGYANHAEVNVVPIRLAARFGEELSFEKAAYGTLAAIALQALRVGRPAIGETAIVIGLGPIGLLLCQLLSANGCRVLGVDPKSDRRQLALDMGAERALEPVDDVVRSVIDEMTDMNGCDAVYVAASTSSNGPIESAGKWTRKKGVVIAVGAVGLQVPRRIFYEKELELRLSTSYGPGRYDAGYEELGIDYPYAYVRWTEQRNLESVLHLMERGRLDPEGLTTHRFAFDDAVDAYRALADDDSAIGIVLNYAPEARRVTRLPVRSTGSEETDGPLGIGVIGAGSYARQYLIPALARRGDVRLTGLVTQSGASAVATARRFGFGFSTTDPEVLFADEATRAIVIATRHDSHAEYVVRALASGRLVFVEKPLAITSDELLEIEAAYQLAWERGAAALMVGLNRRFSPMLRKIKSSLVADGPLAMTYVINPGRLPENAWVLRDDQGGGLLVSEGCHFIDVMQYLCGSEPTSVFAATVDSRAGAENSFTATISFADGSVGTLSYGTAGDSSAGKEHLLVSGRGVFASLRDFRRLDVARGGRVKTSRSRSQDKGQRTQLVETVRSFIESASAPVPFRDLSLGMHTVFAIREALRSGQRTDVDRSPGAIRVAHRD